MEIKQLKAAIEAILFSSGDPVSIEKLSQITGTDKDTVNKIISIMAEERENKEYGVSIIRLDDCCQLAAKPEYAHYIRSLAEQRRNMPLTPASMETLAIIAYNQPVTKSYIEQVRGVDSSGTVSSLEKKGLIEERGRLDIPGRPILYGTTLNFLRSFGLKTLNDLPHVDISEEPSSVSSDK